MQQTRPELILQILKESGLHAKLGGMKEIKKMPLEKLFENVNIHLDNKIKGHKDAVKRLEDEIFKNKRAIADTNLLKKSFRS